MEAASTNPVVLTNQAIIKVWEEINGLSQSLSPPKRKLIDLQMRVLSRLDYEYDISLIPDLMTSAIDVTVSDDINDSPEDARALANFVQSIFLLAKAKYVAICKKQQRAQEFLRESVSMLISNIGELIFSAQEGVVALLASLRRIFLGNTTWVQNLLNLFSNYELKKEQAKDELISFVESVLKRISRYPFLMRDTVVYRELAYAYGDDLLARESDLLNKKYPKASIWKKIYIQFLLVVTLSSVIGGLICLSDAMYHSYAEPVPWLIFFFLFGIILIIYLIVISKSLGRRRISREAGLKKYEEWLDTVKASAAHIRKRKTAKHTSS